MSTNGRPLALVAKDVGVFYNLEISRPQTLKRFAGKAVRGELRRARVRKHWAIRNVSFGVGRGEALGFVGANGSGKTTLLLAVAGALPPDEGAITTYGTPSLLTLGAGFDIELTGRQNIYLNAAYHALSRRETDKIVDAIIDFSELGEFIDVPLRQYSTGMRSRLGFAIVTNLHPDILLLDEALSVGDRFFEEKSRAKMTELMGRAGAIVIASHDLEFLSTTCSRVAWLSQGLLRALGPADHILERYHEAVVLATEDPEAPVEERLEEAPRIRAG